MPNHVECCTYPVLEWIAERLPQAPVNVMAQFHPDNFCDPASLKYRDKYEEIARRPTHGELDASWRRAHELELKFKKPPRSNAAMLSGSRRFWRSEGELAPAVALDLKR